MTIRLIHVHQLLTLYLSYGVKYQSRVLWGHGGQKVIFTKNVSTPFNYVALTLYICYNLTPLYQIYGYTKSPGVIWGHWGQKVIFTENVITCLCHIA